MQTQNGLGRSIDELDHRQIVNYEKVSSGDSAPCQKSRGQCVDSISQAEYANKLLYIAILALAKLSIISLLMILTASDLHRNMGIGLTATIGLWGVVSALTAAFQCGVNQPWQYSNREGHCLSMVCKSY